MNIHEYQAKEILAKYGVAVPAGQVCKTADEAKAAAQKLLGAGAGMVVVKSQIHAGGRGKGTFKSGFQGGVKLCKTAEDARAAVSPTGALRHRGTIAAAAPKNPALRKIAPMFWGSWISSNARIMQVASPRPSP